MKGIFSKETNSVPLMNIATGVVASKNVSVHKAKQLGCSYLVCHNDIKFITTNEIKLSKGIQCTQIRLKLKRFHDAEENSGIHTQLSFQRTLEITESVMMQN